MGGLCWFHIPLASTTLAAEKINTWRLGPLHARFVSVLKGSVFGVIRNADRFILGVVGDHTEDGAENMRGQKLM